MKGLAWYSAENVESNRTMKPNCTKINRWILFNAIN